MFFSSHVHVYEIILANIWIFTRGQFPVSSVAYIYTRSHVIFRLCCINLKNGFNRRIKINKCKQKLTRVHAHAGAAVVCFELRVHNDMITENLWLVTVFASYFIVKVSF